MRNFCAVLGFIYYIAFNFFEACTGMYMDFDKNVSSSNEPCFALAVPAWDILSQYAHGWRSAQTHFLKDLL